MSLNGNPESSPTIFHITHYKAGSQWIHVIFRKACRERIVQPEPDLKQFFEEPIKPGRIYPTLYLTREEFESANLPERWRRFIVIRDLRDTLVSGYFSLKTSHREKGLVDDAKSFRAALKKGDTETGLMATMEQWLPSAAADIQESWLKAGEPAIRYEDLLAHDWDVLERVLIDECELPIDRGRLRTAVKASRFDRHSGGRERGEEDESSHWRKGIAGDWKNHFSEPLKDAFKERWGYLLIAAGYETDLDW